MGAFSKLSPATATASGAVRSPWPFNGLFGSGADGSFNITSNTTATKFVIQATNFTIDNATYTVKQQNPGGILIACTGTFKMTGTAPILDANGQGGLGATVTAGWGQPGFGFAGQGGQGGGGGVNQAGGFGGAILSCPIYSQNTGERNVQPYNIPDLTNATVFDTEATATVFSHLITGQFGGFMMVPSAGVAGNSNGNAGVALSSTLVTPWFDLLSSFDIMKILGVGSGGGNSQNGNAGGNGGGVTFICCNEFDFQSGAIMRANGAAGVNGGATKGGGGGGGGCIVVLYRTLTTNAGTIQVNGGTGGTGALGIGGNGSTGFSKTSTI